MIICGTQEEINSLEYSLEEFCTNGSCRNISCDLCPYLCGKHEFGKHIKVICLSKELLDEIETNIFTN